MKVYVVELLLTLSIGFVGSFFWLRQYANKWIAIAGAVSYVLMAHGIIQTPINSESYTASMAYPWVALGVSLALQKKPIGVGLLSLGLWMLFTMSYIGMALIFCEFIFLFCLVEWIILNFRKKSWQEFGKGIGYVAIGCLLFLCIYSLPLFEIWHFFHFDMGQIRDAGANNPFAASAQISSLFSLWYPNEISSLFIPDAHDGYIALLYVGSINVIFLFYTFLTKRKNHFVWLLWTFAIVSFLTTLSAKYPFGALFLRIMPFFAVTRWHAWNINIPVFFLITLAAIGFSSFVRENSMKRQLVSIGLWLVGALVVIRYRASELYVLPTFFLSYPQTIAFTLFFFVVISLWVFSAYKYRAIMMTLLLSGVIMLELGLVTQQLYLFNDRYTWRPDDVIRTLENSKTPGFPVPSNRRTKEDDHINTQYYDKKPTLYGYSPIILPSVYKLMKQPLYPILFERFFYLVTSDSLPDDTHSIPVTMRALTTDRIEAELTASKDEIVVLSTVYTPNWQATIDGKPLLTSKNAYDLTQFTLPSGTHTIRFLYRPWYLWLSLGLMIFGLFVSLTTVIVPTITKIKLAFDSRN